MKIALVVLDSLRKDTFDMYFDWLSGLHFESAWSPSNWTMPAHGSLFTGLYPSEHGAHGASEFFDYSQVLPEKLSSSGYVTRVFSANVYISPAFGFDRGFDDFSGPFFIKPVLPDYFNWREYGGKTDSQFLNYCLALRDLVLSDTATLPSLQVALLNRLEGVGIWTPSHHGIVDAIDWIDQLELSEREFLLFNFMETHVPYHYIPDSYTTNPDSGTELDVAERLTEDEKENRCTYHNAAEFLSDQYHRLFAHLAREMDYVITVSDHGESLGENGVWGHGQDTGLYPEITRIPLVISGNNVEPDTCDEPVDLLDIHRTIAVLSGVDTSGHGRNLLEPIDSRTLLQETYKVRNDTADTGADQITEPFRGIVTEEGDHVYETADRLVNADAVANADEKLQAAINQLDERSTAGREHQVSQHVERQLENLGYR